MDLLPLLFGSKLFTSRKARSVCLPTGKQCVNTGAKRSTTQADPEAALPKRVGKPKGYALIIILLIGYNNISAQIDTSLLLPSIQISATKIEASVVGTKSEQWDSTKLSTHNTRSIGDWLSRETGIFIKNYGQGTLATSAMRGGSAGHTLVLWNGLPLQSPMLGLLDLSLLPIGIIDEATIHYGGNGSAWGSGAIGGVIELKNSPKGPQGISIGGQTQIGSFGRFNQNLTINYGAKKWNSRTQFVYLDAKNDFSYRIAPNQPLRKQTNAHQELYALLQDFRWQITPSQSITLLGWWQQNHKEIPPNVTQNKSLAHQRDKAIRSSLQWERKKTTNQQKLSLGWTKESILYKDDLYKTEAPSGFTSIIGNFDYQQIISSRIKILSGLSLNSVKAHSNGYPQDKTSTQYGGFLRTQYTDKNILATVALRQEIINNKTSPLLPSLGVKWHIHRTIYLQGKVTRNFRVPTLNDRYWAPGGNPDLLPERGWSTEMGAHFNTTINKLNISYNITGFNRKIDQWIMWAPDIDLGIWRAQNITKVWSRGIEQSLSLQWQHKDWSIRNTWRLDWIKSTSLISIDVPKITKGEQLIYTPAYKALTNMTISYRQFSLHYQQGYTSRVKGTQQYLEAYTIGNISLLYHYQLAAIKGQLYLNIDNLWNTNYRVIEKRIMPGRAFELGIKWQWK